MSDKMVVTKDDFVSYCSHTNNPRTRPDYSSDCDCAVENPGELCKKHKSIQEFIKTFNNERKRNKGKWFVLCDTIGGVEIKTKTYNTWIQLLHIGGIKYSAPMDCTVKVMNKFLEDTLNYHPW
jgi:hypothetical protein